MASPSSADAPENGEQDILALVAGVAPAKDSEQIWIESLRDPNLRRRLTLSLPSADEQTETANAIALPSDVLSRKLQQRRNTLLASFVSETASAGGETSPIVTKVTQRVLRVLETLLTLPCLAPALAASYTSQIDMPAQSVVTEEAVRVEFQQLPQLSEDETANAILRVIVDASELDDDLRYTRAFVIIAKETGSRVSLSIPLNARSVGYLDTALLSPSTTAHRIVGVTLQEG